MPAAECGPIDVACVGEAMVMLVPDPPAAATRAETFRRHIGGAESNVAVHLARARHRVTWRSALGDDAFGDYVRGWLADNGVRCDARIDPERLTGVYFKERDGQRTSVRYYRSGSAASTLGSADAHAVLELRPKVVHTSGITAALSASAEDCVRSLLHTEPQRRPLISFDVNYRPQLHGASNAQLLKSLARRADIVFCGLDEAEALWGCRDVEDVRRLLDGPQTVVIKQGANGATAFHRGVESYQPALPVTIVDPVGAGDAFAAGYLDGVLSRAGAADCLWRGVNRARDVLEVPGDLVEVRGDRAEGGDGRKR